MSGETSKRSRKYTPVEELERNFEREAAWADARYGADVPRLTRPGRPRKGSKVERTSPHSIRVADSVWSSLRRKAKTRGLSANAALQLAAMEWVGKG